MISGLKHALQPAVTDLSIKFDVPPSFKVYQAPEEVPALFSGDKVVVYGIIKKRKSAPDECLKACVNGTATLTGQILGKPIQFKLTFEIPPPSEFKSSVEMPIIHHLASKALIRDLENGESWTDAATYKQRKKGIVNLSIESGVVSSYTAHIALDEAQDQLIEGAVKTWDIVATMAQYREVMSPPNQAMHYLSAGMSECKACSNIQGRAQHRPRIELGYADVSLVPSIPHLAQSSIQLRRQHSHRLGSNSVFTYGADPLAVKKQNGVSASDDICVFFYVQQYI